MKLIKTEDAVGQVLCHDKWNVSFLHCTGIDLSFQIVHTHGNNVQCHLFCLFKTGYHLTMYIIHAASADTVVRMILHQKFPSISKQILRIFHPLFCRNRSERFCHFLKQHLTADIPLFDINAGGCCVR